MLRRHPLLAALLLIIPLTVTAMAQQKASKTAPVDKTPAKNVLPFQATETTLKNGLKVIVVPTGFPNLVSLQIPVQTGSRNEVEPGKSGFAHFFEHMMFRGTKEYPPERYQNIMTAAGARQNAYTSDDLTNYHITFAKEDLETMLKVEADRFMNLSYAPEAFKTEARAVLGEYNKNAANPLYKLDEAQRESAYTTHTYKHTVMGFLKDIEDMPNQFDYSRTFFERWYRPENVAVIVAGDVDPKQTVKLVEKYWGVWKPAGTTQKVEIPKEPEPQKPIYAHVAWKTPTLPWVTVAFHGPAFSETEKDYAAMELLMDLYFGETSDLYKKLVEQEQKVDRLMPDNPGNVDPSLISAYARLKSSADAVYVRDAMLKAFAEARTRPVSAKRLEDAKNNKIYGFVRTLDNTDRIASTLARYVHYRRSYDTLNNVYKVIATLTPDDLLSTAQRYFTDKRLVVTTLSHDALPKGIEQAPAVGTLVSAAGEGAELATVVQKSPVPQLNIKLLFTVGSAHDPKGKEGLAALSGTMLAEGGSKALAIDEINKALYPMAGSFSVQVDKEMTTFTGSIHRDNVKPFLDIVLPQLLDPGMRPDDFKRLKDRQLNALTTDLRSNNEEELGKERLQGNIFAGTPYGHPVLGTVAGIQAITLDDVKDHVKKAYTRANLTVGISGDIPDELLPILKRELGTLPAQSGLGALPRFEGRKPKGMEVEIIQKETAATAISFGHPIAVTRSHPDFPALTVMRAWLGEHRSSVSHLYQQIREIRGMNYGDYAYIEAFPRGMYQFFPDPNIARRAQLFEIWLRPVQPQNAHHALRIAHYELEKLIQNGMSPEDFERTREYLMKNVYIMTATQNAQLGYALDSRWYGIPEYTTYMREKLKALTVADVNRAMKEHLSSKDLSMVIITKDAAGLKNALVSDAVSTITYDAEKPKELLEEDKLIGARKLGIPAANVRITPVDQVFAK
ncbi:MAG: pitrilysin family protein [Myxococcota bacterium]